MSNNIDKINRRIDASGDYLGKKRMIFAKGDEIVPLAFGLLSLFNSISILKIILAPLAEIFRYQPYYSLKGEVILEHHI